MALLRVEIFGIYFGSEERLNVWGGGGRWCQVLDGLIDASGLIEEIKSPCGGRGFRWDRIELEFNAFTMCRNRLLGGGLKLGIGCCP